MKNSILILQYLIDILKSDDNLMQLVQEENLIPVDARLGTSFPFIVLVRNGISPQYCKDGCYRDVISVSVFIVADKYITSVQVAEAVRNTLDFKRFKFDETDSNEQVISTFHIKNITMANATEDLYNDAFVQKLDFNIEV